jgi:two-component system, chemotaxis family, sensor kinase CheA
MDDEILAEFIVESTEALDQLDVELVELERDPTSTPTLSSIFRRIHTIKGTCGFLGLDKLESVTHIGENLLSRLRDGELTVTPEITSELLALTDAVREMIDAIASTGAEGPGDYSVLLERLRALAEHGTLDGAGGTATEVPPTVPAVEAPDAAQPRSEPDPPAHGTADGGMGTTPEAATDDPTSTREVDPESVRVGELLVAQGRVTEEDVAQALATQRDGDPRHVGEILVSMGRLAGDEVVDALNTQGAASSVADSSIRVDVDLLDRLMNLVGELVLNRNQVLQFTKDVDDAQLTATLQRLDLITTELQGSVMQTRMQPIENAWGKYPRIVRDLARQTGKDVELVTHGRETELDKTLLEAIKDPLTHIVRNAVDHGIEPPDLRESRGKPRVGTLVLRAFHESGQVNIEISDDGAGIDPERVKAKAVANGVITADHAARMTRREAIDLIFAAGLSTAESVSNISGRGVGMDVVRTNIEQIGGTVDVTSEPGAGTTIRVKIPLTLAIIPALVVTSGTDQYAIPQVNLIELVRLTDLDGPGGIEHVHGSPVHRLRGELLPLVFLADVLGDSRSDSGPANIVVLRAGERTFGLVVDGIEDTAEIVVKPLGRLLKHLSIFAGATIMGDGHVALILDVLGLASHAGLPTDTDRRDVAGPDDAADSADIQTLLLFELTGDRTYGIPLTDVSRLEEFRREDIEHSGPHLVVQYRGRILPLIDVAAIVERGAGGPLPDLLQVVVHADGDAQVGLVVGTITDIVQQALEATRELDLPGVAASAVVQGRVTDIIDVDTLLHVSGVVARH